MHDHIEEMGMNIVRRSHPDNPHKHSRLWIHEEIKEILANDLGTKKTRYICSYTEVLSPEIVMQGLRKMKELIVLYLYGVIYDASESQNCKVIELPNALQYLFWERYPFRSLPTTFKADKLVALEMPDSRIVQLWEGGERKVLNKLRFLDLSGSDLRTFDLGVAPNLETLDLRECVDLIELRLPERCSNLRSLKVSGSKLSCLDLRLSPDLEKLDLGECVDLIELHLPHRCLNLRSLKLYDSILRTLDIGLSPNLKYLDLRDCHDLEEFHMADGCLKKLVYLDLSGCLRFRYFQFQIKSDASCSADESVEGVPLAELHLIAESVDECHFHPDSNLPKLQFNCYYKEDRPLLSRNLEKLISVGLCACTNLDTFSRSICGLQHLRKLRIKGSIIEAPKDLDQLQCLQHLDFSDTRIRHLPDSICMLQHLKSIKLGGCSLLEKLPEDLGRLECLENLDLSFTNFKVLPGSICKLKHLEFLSLDGWSLLQKLPEDLGQLQCLKKLTFSNTAVKELPDGIFMLKHLEILNLYHCSLLQKLPENLGQIQCLKELCLSTAKMKYLPDSICMLKHLKYLNLDDCSLLEKLPEELGRLECLKYLKLRGCELLREVPDSICKMKCLIRLDLEDCKRVEKLPKEIGRLECLESLNLQNTAISHLPLSILLLKGLCIYGSRGILQSCGFTSEIRCLSLELDQNYVDV